MRVRGAKTMRCERVRVPLPIVRGVKSLDDEPRGASAFGEIPFPGMVVSISGAEDNILEKREPIQRIKSFGIKEGEPEDITASMQEQEQDKRKRKERHLKRT